MREITFEELVKSFGSDATCSECGCLLDFDLQVEHDGELYCEDCFASEFVDCYHCGEFVRREDTVYVDGDIYCTDCAYEVASFCDCCNEYTRDSVFETWEGDNVCERCIRDYYYYCEDCGNYVHERNAIYDDDSDTYYCPDCYNSNPRIGSWHSHKGSFTKFGFKRGHKFVGLGFELEIDADEWKEKMDTVDELEKLFSGHVVYESDGSLDRGFEIISHPHTWEEFEKLPLEMACQILVSNGWLSHNTSTCGLHVHISRNAFGDSKNEIIRNLAKTIMVYDKNIDSISKVARREPRTYCYGIEDYIKWCSDIPRDSELTYEDYFNFAIDHYECMDRYRVINLNNYETVEFRQGKGTLRADSLRAWCEFCYLISVNSKSVDEGETDLALFLNGASENLISYMDERGVKF